MSGSLKNSQAEFVFPKNFEIKFGKANFLITNFKIPSVTAETIEVNYLNYTGNIQGTNLSYDPLNVNMICSDNLSEFKALKKWINSGESFDFSVITYNNMNEKQELIKFKSCLINSISELGFDYLTEDPESLNIDITIKYDSWEFI